MLSCNDGCFTGNCHLTNPDIPVRLGEALTLIIKKLTILIIISFLLIPNQIKGQELKLKVIQVNHPALDTDYKIYAREKVSEKWGDEQFDYFYKLINKESGWNPQAQNPTSSAFGIAQFLNSTWESVGCVKTDDPKTQIDCAIKYIELRHQNPQNAWTHSTIHNWY